MLSVTMLAVTGALSVSLSIVVRAWLVERRTGRTLRAALEEAHARELRDQRELTQRSALDSLKDEFVSTVSHELRTPLTSIRGALGLLSSGVLGTVDAQAKNLLRIALTNTERLIRLINDILDLERMDSGRSPLQVRRCSLPELVHQAIETMTAMADAAEVKLSVAPAAKLVLPSVFFDGDADRILQVITNLLSNAIKFSPANSTVTIEVETPPEALIFRISDQGRGIPEDQLEAIFERFKQVEPEDARQRSGTGLGLAICRSIIQQHGGTIWAERNPAKGSSVCVRLPRQQRTYDVPVQEPIAPAVASIETRSVVMVCDDDRPHRVHIASQLRSHGHTVLEAASCEEAIQMAQTRPANSPLQAILVDLHMADVRGWDLLHMLARNAATSNVPIAMLSIQRPPEIGERHGRVQLEGHVFADLGRALNSRDGAGGGAASHVLLMEDDADLAGVVIGGFAGTGVLVDHAATLDRAMAHCRDTRPDLMILDLTLPGGEGFAMVEWLRVRPDLRSMPMIVYSGRELSQEERARLRGKAGPSRIGDSNAGSTRFLSKTRVQTQDVEQLVLSMVYDGGSGTGQETRRGGNAAP